MAEYLLTGKNAGGRRETIREDASSADEAVAQLRERGYTDITLHTDDVSAVFTRQSDVETHITPADYVELRSGSGYWSDVFFSVKKMYLQSWIFDSLLLAFFVYRRYVSVPWGITDAFLLTVLVLPLVWSLIGSLFSSARNYSQVIEQMSWGRWTAMLELLERYRSQIPAHEATRIQAIGLAGLGQLEEALCEFARLQNDKNVPEWMYWAQLGDVYLAAELPERSIEVAAKAAQLEPGNATLLLDLAMSLLRYHQDVPRAQTLLAQAQEHAIADMLVPFVAMTEGQLALETDRPADAVERFQSCLVGLERLRASSPLMGVMIDRTHAYLAIAEAKQGNRDVAVQHYRLAEPRLLALNSEDLLRRCRELIGTVGEF